MTFKKCLFFAGLCVFLVQTCAMAQDKTPVKFGKVIPEDFNVMAPDYDTSAAAVILADVGDSHFEGDPKGGVDLFFTRSCRIKILKRSGFDAATLVIPLYSSGSKSERITGLRAATYTLEDGKVVETKVDDKSIFIDKLSNQVTQRRFAFPALKEGAIVEYKYTVESPFHFNLQSWWFQGAYPCLWSEYTVEIPDFFQYVTLAHGFVPFSISTTVSRPVNFHLTDPGGVGRDEQFDYQTNIVTHRWVIRNVPSLKAEPFTTSVENYLSRLEFQYARFVHPDGIIDDEMGNWGSISEALLKADDFGADLDRNNGWLDDEMKTIMNGASSPLEKAKKIYAFVRDNFSCNSHSRLYMDEPLKTIYKNRHGSEAELNLLLTAMLRHEQIACDPVILSTRDNGFPNEIYPLLSRFNYVISMAHIDSTFYTLDASEPWLGFSRLPLRCYNGYARVLNKENPSAIELDANGMKESKMTMVFITKDEKGGLSGRLTTTPGFNEACDLRAEIKSSGTGELLKHIKTAYSEGILVDSLEIDSLTKPEEPLQMAYNLEIKPDRATDIIYFNPMLGEAYKENPFKSADRKYPVEMPFAMDEIYTLTMDIPEGYVVDELPKSAKVLFNEDQGTFEYLIAKGDDNIQFKSRIRLNQANFKPEDYTALRDFFGYIVKKQSEQIVFKKKK
jgi:hypothetical protein